MTMHSLFAGIHLQNKAKEFLPLKNVDFERNIRYLKEEIARKVQCDANSLEIIYNGSALHDDVKLEGALRPNATVHCFKKTKKYTAYQPTKGIGEAAFLTRVQELFNVIAHIQIHVTSRVNILQKILAEYPEFRRNLGAQALIRDSVLFNTLHQPEVIKSIAERYPIICEAAPFIVDTVKKELARSVSNSNSVSETATDSTNSSEEETNSNERTSADSAAASSQSENARIRMITRQQLQAALANIAFGSVNSLSNIAQRNANASAGPSTTPSNSSSTLFGDIMQRAANPAEPTTSTTSTTPAVPTTPTDTAHAHAQQQANPTETPPSQADTSMQDTSDDGTGDIPVFYRTHQYAEQLRTMAQMGFIDYEENLTYLNLANGNIENAVNLLMGAMN